MTKETAGRILEAAGKLDMEFEVRQYSGRGMFGAETTAIVCEDSHDFMKAAALAAADLAFEKRDYDRDEVDEFVNDLPSRRDNLGHQTVLY